jgi:hypothetical protein
MTLEDGKRLPKHIGINLEYMNKISWLLDAFCWSFTIVKCCVKRGSGCHVTSYKYILFARPHIQVFLDVTMNR